MQNIDSSALYRWLYNEELQGDDNQRFYCAYLLGHVSLTEAECEESPSAFLDKLNSNLAIALQEDRLTDDDRMGIHALLQQALLTLPAQSS